VELGTGRSKKVVQVDDADEGVKYARAAIEYEELRGAAAIELLDAADGDHPQAALAEAVAPAVHALDGAPEDEEQRDEEYFENHGIALMNDDERE
jgi:hypothetical protein